VEVTHPQAKQKFLFFVCLSESIVQTIYDAGVEMRRWCCEERAHVVICWDVCCGEDKKGGEELRMGDSEKWGKTEA